MTLLDTRVTRQLEPGDATACREARRLVASACAALPTDVVDQVMLVASELVTNAALHAGGPVAITVTLDGRDVEVAVGDGSASLPQLVGTPGAHGGYGLRLVGEIARAWGVAQVPGGKTVWARVAYGPGEA